ncbi:hypothetical protein KEM55_008479 [Ascosphaera atra]|nr:hypothetical protein KEM55_008479 [Ascosphaera atra]
MDSEAQQSKQAVPKFTSFKPKVPLRAEESRDEKRHPSSARRERSRERHHRDHRGPREHRHHRETSSGKGHADYREHRHRRPHDEHRHHRDGRTLHERQVAHPTSTPGDGGDLYVIDTKGDKYNVVYGSLHRYDVPHYRRAGRGRVLGVPLNYWIDRDSLDGKTLVLQTHANVPDDGSARKSRDAAWKHARKATKLYRVMQDTSAKTDDDLQKDFLSLEFGRASKRRRLDSGDPSEVLSSSEDELNYRSIEGKAKTPQLSELGLEADAAAEEDPVGAAARAKNAELTKRLSEHPNDVNAWLALIEHQGELVGHVDIEGHRRLTAAERSSVADVRMSMYEKALKTLPSNVPRDRLILGLLEEGAKLWDTKTIANKWRQYLQQYPNYLSLWIRYLNFQQTNFLSFTFENCRSFIVDCIKMTEPTREMAFSAGNEEQKQIRLYLLLRLSLLMRESGFMESAVALWQALLEFTFFRPKHFNLPGDIEAAVTSFGDFWDSEVARIGDPGAKGWDSNASSPVEPKTDESYSASLSMKFPFASWERAEWRQMRASFLPARSTDETTEDDPYRVILSSDLQDFLADFTSPELSDLLIDAFLLFCRLPPLHSRDTMASKWFLDPFVRNDYLDCRAGMEPWFAMLRPESAEGTSMGVNSFPVQNLLLTPDTLFAGADWFSAFRNFQQVHQRETSLLDVAWIRRAIRHLVSRLPNNDRLAEYSAALEFACSPTEAKPYIKRLLKQRPSSVRLYNAYALVEFANGNADSAEGMLRTTLSMSHGFSERDRSSCILLWRTWVWEALKQGQPGKAMKLLAFMASGQVPSQVSEAGEILSPTEVVKVQKVN